MRGHTLACLLGPLLMFGAQGVSAAEPGECKYLEQPSADTTPAKETKITLLGTTPAEGGDVRKDTIIGVDVEYRLAEFRADSQLIVTVFSRRDDTTAGPGEMSDTPALTSIAGKVHLCVPLKEVYEDPRMRWPLSMSILLLEMTGARGGLSSAWTRSVKFNALDPPERSRAVHVEGPDDRYRDSLRGAAHYFESRAARYKVCIARIPALQPALTKAFRAWEGRHRADIELVAERKFELAKAQANGRADVAAMIGDSGAEAQRDSYVKMPAPKLKEQCDWMLEELADPEDPTLGMIGDYLEAIRKNRPKPPEGAKP